MKCALLSGRQVTNTCGSLVQRIMPNCLPRQMARLDLCRVRTEEITPAEDATTNQELLHAFEHILKHRATAAYKSNGDLVEWRVQTRSPRFQELQAKAQKVGEARCLSRRRSSALHIYHETSPSRLDALIHRAIPRNSSKPNQPSGEPTNATYGSLPRYSKY